MYGGVKGDVPCELIDTFVCLRADDLFSYTDVAFKRVNCSRAAGELAVGTTLSTRVWAVTRQHQVTWLDYEEDETTHLTALELATNTKCAL